MRVHIKLRNQGIKRQPKWWLIVQPCKSNLRGKYLEHIGTMQMKERKTVKRHLAMNIHRANYWLSVGAIPTKGAHRALARYGLLPHRPPRYGTSNSYEKPEKIYKHTHFWGFGTQREWNANQVAFHYKQKLQEQMNLVERKRRLAHESISNAGGKISEASQAIDSDAEDTEDIDSDDPDIFERKKKFEKVLKKFNKHRDEKMIALKGNDLRYNVYLKKMQKLSRKDLGLDVAAYKDYVHNLKEFAHINQDLNIFAYDNLGIGSEWEPQQNWKAKTKSPSQKEIQQHLQGNERVQANRQSVMFTLAKFLRTNSGFINQNDHNAVKEMTEHLNTYLIHDTYFVSQLHKLYDRRKKQQNSEVKKDYMFAELLDQEVPQATIKKAKVSQKEFNEIIMLLKFDRDIFAPESDIHPTNDLLVDNPYSYFVNFDRLPKKIPENIKQLLYRPERMARLSKAYHRLAILLNENWQRKVQEKKDWEQSKHRRLDWHQRQIPKTDEEYALIDKLCRAVETNLSITTEEGMREINDKLTDTTIPIEQYQDIHDWYKPQLTRLIEERRKTPKNERLQQFRDDSIDEVDTTDLENWTIRGLWLDEDGNTESTGDSVEPQHSMNNKLNLKIKKEQQAKDRIQTRLALLYNEDVLSQVEDHSQRGQAGDNWKNEMDQRNFDRARRKELLTQMSPDDIAQEKKRMIFRFLQDELDKNKEYESEEEEEEQVDDDKHDVFDSESEREEAIRQEYRETADIIEGRLPDKNEMKQRTFEVDLDKERKRIFDRHRFNIIQATFGQNADMAQLREYKRIFKIEMEENPERYSLATKDNGSANSGGSVKQAQKQAEDQAYSQQIPKERKEEINAIRAQLDEYIPQIKKIMDIKPNFKDDPEYRDLIGEVNMLEDQLREIQAMSEALDPEIVGVAAAVQNTILQPELVLSPENLKYLARQLRGLLALRKHLPVNSKTDPEGFWEMPLEEMKDALYDSIKARNKEHKKRFGEEIIDTSSFVGFGSGGSENLEPKKSDLQDVLSYFSETQPTTSTGEGEAEGEDAAQSQTEISPKKSNRTPEQQQNVLDRIEDCLGPRFIQTIEDGNIDFEHLAVVDPEVIAESRMMSDEWILAKAEQYEKDAALLEEKLTSGSMTLRERAEYDKHVPFSLQQHDFHIEKIKEAYESAAQAKKDLEQWEAEEGPLDEEQKAIFLRDSEISPELEAEYKKIKDKENQILRNQAPNIMQEKEFMVLSQEEMDECLDAVINNEQPMNEDEFEAFFDEQWEKLLEYHKANRKNLQQAPLEQPAGNDHFLNSKNLQTEWSTPETYQYESMTVDDFVLDRENERKYHMYHQERIGRYPHGFRHFENFANYSQYKREATIQEYMEVMNRPCEFSEYLAIMRQHLTEDDQRPENIFERKREIINNLENAGMEDQKLNEMWELSLEELREHDPRAEKPGMPEYLKSEQFVDDCRKRFSDKVQRKLLEREQFTLVQAFEETIDFWETGTHMFHVPLANTYIPMRHTIMKKPNLLDEDLEDDEFGYQYNNYDSKDKTRQKLHPFEQLSPLRSNRMGPGISRLTDHYLNKSQIHEKRPVRRFQWRRLSKVLDRNFSTNNAMGGVDCGVSLPERLWKIPDPSTAYNPFRQ